MVLYLQFKEFQKLNKSSENQNKLNFGIGFYRYHKTSCSYDGLTGLKTSASLFF